MLDGLRNKEVSNLDKKKVQMEFAEFVGSNDYGVMFDVFNEYIKEHPIDEEKRQSVRNFLNKVKEVHDRYF